MAGQKYYAVYNGREGTQIYLTWDEAKANVSRVSGVIYKSFRGSGEAQAWLQGIADAKGVSLPKNDHRPYGYPTHHHPMSQSIPSASQDEAWPTVAGPSGHAAPVYANGRNGNGVRYDAVDVDDIMNVDDHDSDIEILDGPPSDYRPSARAQRQRQAPPVYEYVDDDSDIEIFDGPPPIVSRTASADPAPPPSKSPTPAGRAQGQPAPAAHLPPPAAAPAPAPALRQRSHTQSSQSSNGADDTGDAPAPTAPRGMPLAGPVHEIQLSPDQLYVLAKVKNGESVFFTGSAGTGKSVLLREIKNACGGRPSALLGVTASTGIASVNIGGCTLHSWAGIGLGKEDKDSLVGRILGLNARAYKEAVRRRKELLAKRERGEMLTADEADELSKDPADTAKSKILERWRKVKTLIIDEISMIDGKLFDKLEYIARKLRKNTLAFGGIQLVLSGDFCQLPPVPDKDGKGGQIPACFAFDSESWNRCVGPPIVLNKVFRQKDQKFVDMLNAMRFGLLDEETTNAFYRLDREVKYDDGILPTELYPTRNEVESANSTRLERLPGPNRNYKALDAPGRDERGREYPPERVERALKDMIVPKQLPLKEGAQVMLVKNIIQGLLVNGSVGRVVGFYKPREAVAMGAQIALPESRDQGLRKAMANGDDRAAAQGQRGQGAPDGAGQGGQASAAGGALDDPQREQKLKTILALNTVWPAVQFQQGPLMLCVPLSFEVVNADANIEAVREQVPLILAWALSIHKSQGQTLERVRVDLNRTFEKGQAYVALSRATRIETLQVVNFDPAKVRAHPRVLEWMAEHMDKVPDLPYIPDGEDEDVNKLLDFWA